MKNSFTNCPPCLLAEMAKVARLVARPQKCYINRLERFTKRHIRNRSTNQIAENSLFSSEIILNNTITWLVFDADKTRSGWLIRGHYSPVMPTGRLQASKNKEESLNWLLLKNLTSRSCRIDLTIAGPMG